MTFLGKLIFPTLWIMGFGFATLVTFAANDRYFPQFLVFWIAGIVVIYFSCIRMKRVRRDEGALYISNYLKEIRVPFPDMPLPRKRGVRAMSRKKPNLDDLPCF